MLFTGRWEWKVWEDSAHWAGGKSECDLLSTEGLECYWIPEENQIIFAEKKKKGVQSHIWTDFQKGRNPTTELIGTREVGKGVEDELRLSGLSQIVQNFKKGC